ncbi:hypothetical protein AC579_10117 [Pseudocercospora musae]|uniref:Uncharacterized protein n=1 Tax=Pseudocercospora musae TaxID=113226 RepID=A0A139ISG7_9PEZI|nr:hypothetical protein AC579_10117 [Pseudocercospora musae]KXT17649.1 hypothetical protein AC579_10117 [Pseudocercospora musae]
MAFISWLQRTSIIRHKLDDARVHISGQNTRHKAIKCDRLVLEHGLRRGLERDQDYAMNYSNKLWAKIHPQMTDKAVIDLKLSSLRGKQVVQAEKSHYKHILENS